MEDLYCSRCYSKMCKRQVPSIIRNFEGNYKGRGICVMLALCAGLLLLQCCPWQDIFGKGELVSYIIREWKPTVDREGFFDSGSCLLPDMHPDIVLKANVSWDCVGLAWMLCGSQTPMPGSPRRAGWYPDGWAPPPGFQTRRSGVEPRLWIRE